jgi:hypothetical protein
MLRSRRELRHVGAALGLAGGPAAAFGQAWGQTGDAGLHVWLIASLAAAALGALTLPVFFRTSDEPDAAEGPEGDGPGPGFGALFAATVGLVAGCFSAFPMGAIVGAVGGILGGAAGGLAWRRVGPGVTAVIAAAVGLIGPILWLA